MAKQHKWYLTLTDQNFQQEVMQNSKPAMMDFGATWFGPCQMMNPGIQDLAKEYAHPVTVGKVNVDEQPQTSSQYGIQSIPTMNIFKNEKVVDQVRWAVSKKVVADTLNRVLPVD